MKPKSGQYLFLNFKMHRVFKILWKVKNKANMAKPHRILQKGKITMRRKIRKKCLRNGICLLKNTKYR